MKSLSNVVDCLTRTNADCAPAPIFDTIWMAGNAVADDVVKPATMDVTVRALPGVHGPVRDIAPLNT